MTALAQHVIFGIVSASILVLPAVTLTLVYGMLRYPNFAIGDFLTLGGYMIFAFSSALGLPLSLAFVLAGALLGVVLIGIDQTIFRQVRNRGVFAPILLSIGLVFVIQNVIRFIWGNDLRLLDFPLLRPLTFGGLRISLYQLVIIGIVSVAAILLHGLLRYTRIGKAIRATASNPELAEASGIDPEHVTVIVWMGSGFLAALSGGFLALDSALNPLMGWTLLLPLFAVAILGGVGSVYGAFLGALIVGIAQELSVLILPATYKSGIGFLLLAAVLLLRPAGLLGRLMRVS